MGVIQKSINNLLISSAAATAGIQASIAKQEQAKAAEAAKPTEEQQIAATQEKLQEASNVAIGYTQQQARAKTAEKALGDIIGQPYDKKPRGIGQKTFDRRTANAQTMQVILQKASQDAEFRKRIEKFSVGELAAALKPTIDKKQKKEAKK